MISTYILICGTVFPSAEKAPFIESGHSFLGLLEFKPETQEVKCHECGEWRKYLDQHIKFHGITVREYRRDHGLKSRSPLHDPIITAIKRLSANGYDRRRKRSLQPPDAKKFRFSAGHLHSGVAPALSAEHRNLRGICKAQLTERMIRRSIELARTPTSIEFRAVGIHRATVSWAFQLPFNEALRSIGLSPICVKPRNSAWIRTDEETHA